MEAFGHHGKCSLVLNNEELNMLTTILVILLIMWILGMATAHTLGGFIHILLLVAAAVLMINIIQGRKVYK